MLTHSVTSSDFHMKWFWWNSLKRDVWFILQMVKLYMLQAESGFVTRRTMKVLSDWDSVHIGQDMVARPKLFDIKDAEKHLKLEDTLRLVVRVATGYDNGEEYLRRVRTKVVRRI